MKRTLTQSIFLNLNRKWQFATVNKDGKAHVWTERPVADTSSGEWKRVPESTTQQMIAGSGYLSSHWERKILKREKEVSTITRTRSKKRSVSKSEKVMNEFTFVIQVRVSTGMEEFFERFDSREQAIEGLKRKFEESYVVPGTESQKVIASGEREFKMTEDEK